MERDKSEEIIAYRIGEGLFCKDCYEEAARTLKAVQNPEDPQVMIPGKPIKAGDVEIFICKQCKTLKGINEPSEKQVEIPRKKDLSGLRDMVEDCAFKVSFLEDFFCHSIPDDEFLSKSGISGLNILLRELRENLSFVVDEICLRQQKGLVIEKRI